jgi:phage-related protein/acid phosphatase family membrane protein YuiD
MAVEVGTAYVTVLPSAKGFGTHLQSQLSAPSVKAGKDAGDKAGRGFRTGVSGHVKAASGILAGAFAVNKIAGFFRDANSEARESQKVGNLTAQVIKSTGGAAQVTAAQVGKLSTAISNKTGIDDEAIQSGANMLLTFKNIRNEAGKNNDIFNQATKTVTDLASAMGQDPRKAAIQLGKALNDPVKGITALTRVGVTFDDQQKKQIASLVKHGRTLDAQKIILHELRSEFGGAAAAQATMGEKASTAFKNLEEAVGTAFLPVIDKVLTRLTQVIPRVSAFVTQVGPKLTTAVRRATPVLESVGSAIGKAFGFLVDHQNIFVPVASGILAIVAAMKIWAAVTKAYTAIQVALNVVLAANPIGIVVLAIAGLVAGLVIAYKRSETFRRIVNAVGAAIKTAFVATVNWLTQKFIPFFTTTIPNAFNAVRQWLASKWALLKDQIAAPFRAAWAGIKAAVSVIWSGLRAAFDFGVTAIKKYLSIQWKILDVLIVTPLRLALRLVQIAWAHLKGPFTDAVQWIGRTFRAGWDKIKSILSGPLHTVEGWISRFWAREKQGWINIAHWISSTFHRAWDKITGVLSGPLHTAETWIRNFWAREKQGWINIYHWVTGTFARLWSAVKGKLTGPIASARDAIAGMLGAGKGGLQSTFRSSVSAIGKIWAGLEAAVKAPIRFIVNTVLNNGLIAGFNKLAQFAWGNAKHNIPRIPLPRGFVEGGSTPNVGKYTVAGVVHGNEHVVTSDEVSKTPGGHSTWEKLRAMVRGYVGGGRVWPTNTRRLSPTYPGHSGVDIAAGMGAPIYATQAGRIAYTGWNRGFGQAIFEQIGPSLQAVYGHTSRLLARAGQIVQAGQRIGLVGATGHATGPHLHFEINMPGPFGNAADRASSLAYLNGAALGGLGGGARNGLFDFLKGLSPIAWLRKRIDGATGRLGGSGFPALLSRLPALLLGDRLTGLLGGGDIGSGTGKAAGEAVIRQALAMNRIPTTSAMVNAWWRQVLSESGDNPRIVQGITDINSINGNRAEGWLQVIPPTFSRYHFPGHGNIFNKLDNALAAMNYAKHAYGIGRLLSVIGHGHGYAGGTSSASPGWAWVGERGPELMRFRGGEQVMSNRQSAASGAQFNNCQFGADPREVAVELRREERRRMNAVNLTAAA